MAKAPAFQFYVKDWLGDTQLRLAAASSRGIWMDILCYMWVAPTRGVLEGKKERIRKMCAATNEEFDLFLEEAEGLSFCDIDVTDNGKVTLINRRMNRDTKTRQQAALRQKRFRNKRDSNANITQVSSSSSSSIKTICKKCGLNFKPLDPSHTLCLNCFKTSQSQPTKHTKKCPNPRCNIQSDNARIDMKVGGCNFCKPEEVD